jgi:hypothetical protein
MMGGERLDISVRKCLIHRTSMKVMVGVMESIMCLQIVIVKHVLSNFESALENEKVV